MRIEQENRANIAGYGLLFTSEIKINKLYNYSNSTKSKYKQKQNSSISVEIDMIVMSSGAPTSTDVTSKQSSDWCTMKAFDKNCIRHACRDAPYSRQKFLHTF